MTLSALPSSPEACTPPELHSRASTKTFQHAGSAPAPAAAMPHRHRHHLRLLTYDAALVPEGGAAVYAQATAFTLSYGKEPAGHFFHLAALKQAGLYGA